MVPVNYMTIILAVFPVFVVLLLMIFKWKAAEAAPVSALLSIFVAFGAFKAPAMQIAVEGTKGVWNGVAATLVIWTGVVLYRILEQAKFAKAVYKEDYHRGDTARLIEAERKADAESMRMPEAGIAFAALAAAVLLFWVCAPLNSLFSFFSPGFNFPENATGYGVVNEAVTDYSPLMFMIHAGVLLLIADLIGFIVLGVRGRLKHGGAVRVLKKSFEMAAPEGIAVTAVFLMLAVMQGTGQILAMTAGSFRTVNMAVFGVLAAVLVPIDLWMLDKKRVKSIAEEAEEARKSAAAGKKIIVHKKKFYETAEGALSIAFVFIAGAFVLMVIGLWGSDETLVLDGFAAVITAMVFCPMRTFIFEKLKYFL